MAFKVTYCSGQTLDHGSGYGFVVMHRNPKGGPNIKEFANRVLERQFCRNIYTAEAKDLYRTDPNWTEPPKLAFYRRIKHEDSLLGKEIEWSVLGKIRPISDASGRAFFIAEFLLLTPEEVERLASTPIQTDTEERMVGISPVEILRSDHEDLWHQGNRWNEPARWLDAELPLEKLLDNKTDPGVNFAPFQHKGCCWFARRDAQTDPTTLLDSYGSALRLFAAERKNPSLLWQVPFTNFALAEDAHDPQLWIGCWERVPIHEQIREALGEAVVDLTTGSQMVPKDEGAITKAFYFWMYGTEPPPEKTGETSHLATESGKDQRPPGSNKIVRGRTTVVEPQSSSSAKPLDGRRKRTNLSKSTTWSLTRKAVTAVIAGIVGLGLMMLVVIGVNHSKTNREIEDLEKLAKTWTATDDQLRSMTRDGKYETFISNLGRGIKSEETKKILEESRNFDQARVSDEKQKIPPELKQKVNNARASLLDLETFGTAVPTITGLLNGTKKAGDASSLPSIRDDGHNKIITSARACAEATDSVQRMLGDTDKQPPLNKLEKDLTITVQETRSLPDYFKSSAAARLTPLLEAVLNSMSNLKPSELKEKEKPSVKGILAATRDGLKVLQAVPLEQAKVSELLKEKEGLLARTESHLALLSDSKPVVVESTTPMPPNKTNKEPTAAPAGPQVQILFADEKRRFATGTLLSKPGTLVIGEGNSTPVVIASPGGGLALDWPDRNKLTTTTYTATPKAFYRNREDRTGELKNVDIDDEQRITDNAKKDDPFPWLIATPDDKTEAVLVCPVAFTPPSKEFPHGTLRLEVVDGAIGAQSMNIDQANLNFSLEVDFKVPGSSKPEIGKEKLVNLGSYTGTRSSIITKKLVELDKRKKEAADLAAESQRKAEAQKMKDQPSPEELGKLADQAEKEAKRAREAADKFEQDWLHLNLLTGVHLLTVQKNTAGDERHEKAMEKYRADLQQHNKDSNDPKKKKNAGPAPQRPSTPPPTILVKEDKDILKSKTVNPPGVAGNLAKNAKSAPSFSSFVSNPANSKRIQPTIGACLFPYWENVAAQVRDASSEKPLNIETIGPYKFVFSLAKTEVDALPNKIPKPLDVRDVNKLEKNFKDLQDVIKSFPEDKIGEWDKGNAMNLFKHWKELARKIDEILPFIKWEAGQSPLTVEEVKELMVNKDFANEWFQKRKANYKTSPVVAEANQKAELARQAVSGADKPDEEKAKKEMPTTPAPLVEKDVVGKVWLVISPENPSGATPSAKP